MQKSSVVVALAAAGALVLGSIGMASAQSRHSDEGHVHGVIGEDPGTAHRQATGSVTKLTGRVNDASNITLSDTTLSPGRYKIIVRDTTSNHNWHLFGNGQDRATSVPGTGRSVFRIRLTAGNYTVHCDIHQDTMHFGVQVG